MARFEIEFSKSAAKDYKKLPKENELLEGLLDLKAIEDRVAEPEEDYKAYSRKRKSRLHL
jgi:mRNA-degrading endonuclease RelE of RelBE toxin-antitoxin system